MLKRLFLALAFLAGLLSPAYPAGTISLSLMQQFGTDNKPLNGGLLYFYEAGGTTPQNAFQDSGLTIPWPNPLTLGSTGRVPQLFFADGQIKVRLTNAAGVVQLAADNLLVVGPSGGGGGGGSVDPTTVLQTGDVKVRYGTGTHTGFVRQNGRTIGSATSGATERANADVQALFEFLWNTDPNLTVSTGRGASANADWVANKTITLPDARARAMVGVDDMGAGDSGRLNSVTPISGGATTLGSAYGTALYSLLASNLPVTSLGFAGTANQAITVRSNTARIVQADGVNSAFLQGGGTGSVSGNNFAANFVDSIGTFTASGTISVNGGGASFGGGTAFSIMQPSLLYTIYQKL